MTSHLQTDVTPFLCSPSRVISPQFHFFPAHTPISHSGLLLPPLLHDFKLLLAGSPVASTLPWPMVTFLSGAYSQLAAIFDIIDCSLFFRNITYLHFTYTKVWHHPYLAFLLPVCLLLCLPSWVLLYLTPKVLSPGPSSSNAMLSPLIVLPISTALTSSGSWTSPPSSLFKSPALSLDTPEIVEGRS